LPARFVPPSGFGYPPDGFLPAIPCRFYFTPAALKGFTLRSFPLSKGTRRVTARVNPHTVSPTVLLAAEAAGRPGRPRFLGFDPLESPLRPSVWLAQRPPAAPLGFTLLGPTRESLARAFTRPPLTCFQFRPRRTVPAAPQSLDRLSPGPDRSLRQAAPAGRGDPFRVLAPAHDPVRLSQCLPGLCVHLALRRALLSTDQRS
jgi:hypothetical protein